MSIGAAPWLQAQNSESARFVEFANNYIASYLEHNPESATYLGDHTHDHRLSDVSPQGVERELAVQRDTLRRLSALRLRDLDPVSQVDARILKSHLEASIWSTSTLREREWNPMLYNPGYSVYLLLEREFAPLPERLARVQKRLEAVPAFLEAGRINLKTSTRIHAETAIAQTQGTLSLLDRVLDSYVDRAPEMRTSVSAARNRAVAALESWREWMKTSLLPIANKDFRIGPALYKAKLHHTLGSELTAAQIRSRAERDLKQTQASMYDTALDLHRRYFPESKDTSDRRRVISAVLDKLAESRPKAETIVEQARTELKDATEFVRSHGIVSVFDAPLKIVEMPEFQRGVAVASCASPGPFEQNGTTFFNISPPPANWSAAQVESYFREYNDSMVKNLTVHEAMPGHYLQRAHANRFHAPTLTRAIFASGTFTEGWAVYAERIMAENSYGGPDVRMQQLKMRLRTIINALIDQGIHARGMTEQQAMDLMMNEGFQEKSEAAGKWRRAMLTSAQLSTYYVGTTELDAIREEYVQKNGSFQDPKAFHDRMLSFGSPAPRYVRELMGL